MAVLLGLGLVLLGITGVFAGNSNNSGHILGGPELKVDPMSETGSSLGERLGLAFASSHVDNSWNTLSSLENATYFRVSDGLAKDPGGVCEAKRLDGTLAFIYVVSSGDTISSIASDFNISIDTVTQANPGIKSKSLKIGQEITILPTSGVLHAVKDGDSLETLATKYSVSVDKIREFNPFIDLAVLSEGKSLIIPGTTSRYSLAALAVSPSLNSYFMKPAEGFNWGIAHGQNGVDIANVCGTKILASAEGLVVPGGACEMDDGWNGGYGMCITLQHPNGTKTRYAHLSKSMVSIGDYVEKGALIGLMGTSGKSTGCHLHFEVHGAQNPFVLR